GLRRRRVVLRDQPLSAVADRFGKAAQNLLNLWGAEHLLPNRPLTPAVEVENDGSAVTAEIGAMPGIMFHEMLEVGRRLSDRLLAGLHGRPPQEVQLLLIADRDAHPKAPGLAEQQ